MLMHSDRIAEDAFRRLHPSGIEDPRKIAELLERVCREGIVLQRGLNARVDPETATIAEVDADGLVLATRDFEHGWRSQIFLNFCLDGRPFFFATSASSAGLGDRLRVTRPKAIYFAERRDRIRRPPDSEAGDPTRVLLLGENGDELVSDVEDYSPAGLAIQTPGSWATASGRLRLRFLDGRDAGREARVRVRRRSAIAQRPGWVRIGIDRMEGPASAPIRVEPLPALRPVPAAEPAVDAELDVIEFNNEHGENIVALVDSWGETEGAPAVIIPPAWGQTKETLLPLARTIVETFARARRPVSVLRLDGIRKQGESHNDPECRVPGRSHLHFTFSQGVRDILSTLTYLEESPRFGPSTSILVTFSAASIEGRKAVVLDRRGRIGGWICVVGSADLQSMTRAISGGVDFVAGVERGLQFGQQELLGVVVDIDRIGDDALVHGLAFLDEARADLAEVSAPVTWFHGRHDAWMDLGRIRDVLSCGDPSGRRLFSIPTGHQLRTSRHALDTFQRVAVEAGRMALDEELPPVAPHPRDVRARRVAERRRRPSLDVDLRSFWRDYLVGRDRSLGIELMTSATPYRSLMASQIEGLALRPGERVADLGCGTGAFALQLAESEIRGIRVDAFDYVREALARARIRAGAVPPDRRADTRFIECNLDLREAGRGIPVRSASYDAVLASLMLSYVDHPLAVLREARRILKPGGRLVLSSLCRDADISGIYYESLAELKLGAALERLHADGEHVDRFARSFLNDAARILELEESGAFRFWDGDELAALVERGGLTVVGTDLDFGDPPQAVVLVAERR